MKKTAYLAPSAVTLSFILALLLALLMAAPLVANAHDGEDHGSAKVEASAKGDAHQGFNFKALARFFHWGKDKDKDEKRDKSASTTAARTGVVTSVDGSIFTLTNKRGSATTTVLTDASTTYRGKGMATTSGAISIGAHALVFGTKSSTTTVSASFVKILGGGANFFKRLFNR